MPDSITLPPGLLAAIVDHARAQAPNEACGLIVGTAPPLDGGRAVAWHPARNRLASPLRFEIEPEDLVRHLLAMDARDEVVWGIVHSHVRSAAVPSPTDLAGAARWPGTIQIIVSLDPGPGTGEPQVRAWSVADAEAVELAIREA